jgi:hypothetical protein
LAREGPSTYPWHPQLGGRGIHDKKKANEDRRWPGAEVWITEYALANNDLAPTQEYFNQTLDYFDKEDYIGGYTYFGAFRSDVSNVGPNAVFLNNDGELTDIGSFYLGSGATGIDPQSGDGDSAAGRPSARAGALFAGLVGVVGAVVVGLL